MSMRSIECKIMNIQLQQLQQGQKPQKKFSHLAALLSKVTEYLLKKHLFTEEVNSELTLLPLNILK